MIDAGKSADEGNSEFVRKRRGDEKSGDDPESVFLDFFTEVVIEKVANFLEKPGEFEAIEFVLEGMSDELENEQIRGYSAGSGDGRCGNNIDIWREGGEKAYGKWRGEPVTEEKSAYPDRNIAAVIKNACKFFK